MRPQLDIFTLEIACSITRMRHTMRSNRAQYRTSSVQQNVCQVIAGGLPRQTSSQTYMPRFVSADILRRIVTKRCC